MISNRELLLLTSVHRTPSALLLFNVSAFLLTYYDDHSSHASFHFSPLRNDLSLARTSLIFTYPYLKALTLHNLQLLQCHSRPSIDIKNLKIFETLSSFYYSRLFPFSQPISNRVMRTYFILLLLKPADRIQSTIKMNDAFDMLCCLTMRVLITVQISAHH